MLHARHFYVAMWYTDIKKSSSSTDVKPANDTGNDEQTQSAKSSHKKKKKKKRKHHHLSSSDESESDSDSDSSSDEDEDGGKKQSDQDASGSNHILNNGDNPTPESIEKRKKFLLSKINPFPEALPGARTVVLTTPLDAESSELISRFLASKRPFSQSFDTYLKNIIKVLMEPLIAVRSKAMKCLTQIVESDPAVLARTDMQLGVHHSFLDSSPSVREAAVDLVGKFVLSRPELIEKYYSMLSARILDTGVNVRKRVIKVKLFLLSLS